MIFRSRLNKLSVWSNGIPINRNNPNNNTVHQVVDYINNVDKCALVIAPEGRLRKVKYWRSGFYYIALGANMPIVPGALDYGTKTIRLTDEFYPSGDIAGDMAELRDFYEGVTARFPEKTSPVRVRKRTASMQKRLNDRHNNNTSDKTPEPDAKAGPETGRSLVVGSGEAGGAEYLGNGYVPHAGVIAGVVVAPV